MSPSASMNTFHDALRLGSVLLDLPDMKMEAIVDRLLTKMVESGALKASRRQEAHDEVMRRESEASTAIGHAVAVPHARLAELEQPIVGMARLATPVNMGAPDGRPVRFVFLLLGSDADAENHLQLLMSVARLMSDDLSQAALTLASSRAAVLEAIDEFRIRSIEATRTPEPDRSAAHGLARTGRFAGGAIDDFRRRAAYYKSDFTDGLHSKTLGASLFMFFACIAPAVAFGGLMHQLTGGQIGVMEMIVATAVGGVFYAIFSGQPLTIMGGTGPLLVFTAVLYDLSGLLEIAFLPTYALIGLWTAFFTVLIALFDGSALIRYCTRFTDEIFALLISLIFIYEAIKDIWRVFNDPSVGHYTALVSLVLAIGTFYIATTLRDFRRSVYLRRALREFLADFGSVIAISSMVFVAYLLHQAELPALAVPNEFSTTTGRPWIIDVRGVPTWVWFASAVPALLCTVLVYLDQNITSRLVNKSDNKLKKGPAYHLDFTVVGLMIAVCSILGLPWLVAATVRSLNHIRALADYGESVQQGQVHEHIIHVRETRLTGVLIHLLVGLSVFLLPFLHRHQVEIPMSVLFGLFLYMGVSSLSGNEFWERLKLWGKEPASYPSTHYVRMVPRPKLHLFTGIQLVCLVVLWAVKTSAIALFFPLVIAMMVPVRFFISRFFDEADLVALDSEEEPEEEMLHDTGL